MKGEQLEDPVLTEAVGSGFAEVVELQKPIRSVPRPPSTERSRAGRTARPAPHRLSIIVVIVGLAVTAVLTISSRVSYEHNEQHLTKLQTELSASILDSAQVDLERRLGQALDLASEAANPATTFKAAIASSMVPAGPFTTAALRLVNGDKLPVLARLGAKPIENANSKTLEATFERAARTRSLVVTRIVSGAQQRLSYLLSMPSAKGTFVAAASQALPSNRRVTIPADSPDADLNVAIYFGKTTAASALIETNVAHLPITGDVATATVPLGTSVITLVTSAKTPLAGAWSEFTPWGILILGVLFTVAIGLMTDRLVRRRRRAEELAEQNSALYREQRNLAETLQRALLPKQLPLIPGVEFASLYLPGGQGLEVGGDWYSAIKVDDERFVFVVGDVSGHGVGAATVMASLRYTTRAFGSIGYHPSSVLAMANREIEVVADHHFATVLVGLVDLRKREMVLASAGHLNPLLIVDGTPSYIEVPTGPPLGVGSDSYASITVQIPPGASLIGFTDGLVERRDASIETGLRRLARAAASSMPSIDALVKHVADELSHPNREDDIAILGIHWLA